MSGTSNKLVQAYNASINGAGHLFVTAGGIEAANQLRNISSKNAINGDLVFPSDLLGKNPDGYSYYMSFKFSDYVKPSIYDPPIEVFKEGIKLPIPSRLSTDTGVHYQEQALGSAIGAAVQQSANLPSADQLISNPLDSIKNFVASSGENAVSAFAAGTALNAIPKDLKQGISYATGTSVNPFLSVLFDSPSFRSYNFSWKLLPRNLQESQTLTELIRILNKNILPSLAKGFGLYYKYPSIVDISINTPDSSVNLFQFKQAVIEKMRVNYAAANSPAFFRGSSAPAAVEITLNIKEIVLWKSEDYLTETQKQEAAATLTNTIMQSIQQNNQGSGSGQG
jgi:hypothetical protein